MCLSVSVCEFRLISAMLCVVVFVECCYVIFFFLMIRRPPRSTRTDTLFPYTTLFRSAVVPGVQALINTLIQTERFGTPLAQSLRVLAAELRRSEEHTSELQSLMRISYAVFCLKKKKK